MNNESKNEMLKKVETSKKEFAQRLRKRRRQLDLTLSELGELTEVTQSYLSGIEKEVSMPSFGIIVKLSYALKVPISWLLGEDEIFPNGLTYEEMEMQIEKFSNVKEKISRIDELEEKAKKLEQIEKIIGSNKR